MAATFTILPLPSWSEIDAKATDAGKDFIGRLGPHEGLRRFVVHREVSVDGRLEFAGTTVDAAPSRFSVSNANQRSTRRPVDGLHPGVGMGATPHAE